MIMKRLLLGGLLLFFAIMQTFELNAQDVVNVQELPFIQTSGRAERLVEPDQITLEIRLAESDTKGRTSMGVAESNLLKVLKSLDIDAQENLSVVSLSSDFRYQARSNNEGLLTKVFNLKISSSEQLADVVGALNAKDISNINIIKRECSDKEQIVEQLKIEAITKAKATAEKLAAALGQSVAEAIIINEGSDFVADSDYSYGRMLRAGAVNSESSAADVLNLSFEKIKFSVTISVRFLLK